MATVSIPSYTNACIASDPGGKNVLLAGVAITTENRLEVYSISIDSINSAAPPATFVAGQTNTVAWSSSAPKVCFPYPGSTSTAPLLVYQLGPRSFATNIYPNGTVPSPGNFDNFYFTSNKLFSFSGASGILDFATGFTNSTYTPTGSAWTGVRFNSSAILTSSHDNILGTYPTQNPLLSVGTYILNSNTPSTGYHVVFDKNGKGVVYSVINTASAVNSGADRIQTLSNPSDVDMGSIVLTANAIPITMGPVAYILDKAPDTDGSIIIYSISPGTSGASNKLQFVNPGSNAATFWPNLVGTSVGSKLVIYGTNANGGAYMNYFETTTNTWVGMGLIKPYLPQGQGGSGGNGGNGGNGGSTDSKTNVAAIAGGVAGGVVVLALIAFFFFRRRKSKTPVSNVAQHNVDPKLNPAAAPLMEQNYVLQQQQLAAQHQDYQNQQLQFQQQQQQQQQQPMQMQMQQYPPQQQFLPQQQQQYVPQQQQYPPQQQQQQYVSQPPNYQSQPVFFQAQPQPQPGEAYSYTPPTIVPQAQVQESPTIFQPQTSSSPENTYSQASHTVVGSSTPLTPSQPYTPPAHSSHTPASPQYIGPTDGNGYAS